MPEMNAKQYAVLLVSSDEFAPAIEGALLGRRRFTVIRAKGSSDALPIVETTPLDLVLVSIDPSEGDASDRCVEIQTLATRRGLPVVITGVPDDGPLRESCERSGPGPVVLQSAGMERLMEVVATALGIPVRRPVRMSVVFQLEDESAREALGRAVNVSPGGMALEVNRAYDLKTQLLLRFILPGDRERMEWRAQVRWTRPQDKDTYAMGVEFVAMSEPLRKRLASFVERSAP